MALLAMLSAVAVAMDVASERIWPELMLVILYD
jgi:hypothetical protein